jgi:glycosyltransferase involved in cell wall biosynthesis
MPVYNGVKYIREAIDSIIAQTFTDWELLIVNEPSADGSTEIIAEYANRDKRVKLMQNPEKFGLVNSLNLGITSAKGEFIARMDADDISMPERFEKEVYFLEEHPSVGIIGSYQQHFGTKNLLHAPPTDSERIKVGLIFTCDLCHSTVMFRRDLFIRNSLLYDSKYLAEDFELWTRAMQITDFATIPIVLGKYRHSDGNITEAKRTAMIAESGEIVAKTLRTTLHVSLCAEDARLMQGWHNVFSDEPDKRKRAKMLKKYRQILLAINKANRKFKVYNTKYLRICLLKNYFRAAIATYKFIALIWNVAEILVPRKFQNRYRSYI